MVIQCICTKLRRHCSSCVCATQITAQELTSEEVLIYRYVIIAMGTHYGHQGICVHRNCGETTTRGTTLICLHICGGCVVPV